MIRAVLWDIDGTLLESEPLHWEALATVTNAVGGHLTEDSYLSYLGLGMPAVFDKVSRAFGLSIDYASWLDRINDHYVREAHRVAFRPGAVECVDALAARGMIQACVSNSGRRVVDANMRRLGRPHLRFGLSRDDVVNGKPHPEPYLTAAERLGVRPSECLVVEDSPVGAKAGKAAGMRVVAWPEWAELEFPDADWIVSDLSEVDWDALRAHGA
ncbi:MAG TPA: HAD family phosphatase [Azospirillaceae bacterium]|nr:HAD family phosphatase [Azospirillaceae bacterium]